MPLQSNLKRGLLLLIIAGLAVTPFYGISYVIAIALSIKYLNVSKVFSTVLARSVLSLLILAAVIMFSGLVAWIAHIPTHPLLVLAIFGLLLVVIAKQNGTQTKEKLKIINRGDIVSLSLGLVAPAIVIASYFIPNASLATAYQFVSKGWDHGAHMLMIETASIEKGYTYSKDADAKTLDHSGAYPQAWHLASANIADGFGIKFFNPSKPTIVFFSYIITFMIWYTATVFCFSRLAWQMTESTQNKLNKTTFLFLFTVISLLAQLVTFWPALYAGYANYLSSIAYYILFVAFILEGKRKAASAYSLAAVTAMGAALSWFLTLPALVLTVLFIFLHQKVSLKTKLLDLLGFKDKKTWLTYLVATIALATALLQVGIFVAFSDISGADQLNEGDAGDTFTKGVLMFVFICVASVAYWLNNERDRKQRELSHVIVYIITSITIFTVALYIYQMASISDATYYYSKVLRIAFVIVFLFFIPIFIETISKIKTEGSLPKIALATGATGLLIIGSGLSLDGFSTLLQKNTVVSYSVALRIADYLEREDPAKTDLVVFRGVSSREDYNGNPAAKVGRQPLTCTFKIFEKINPRSEKAYKRLAECAKTLNQKIIIITSDKTKDKIRALNLPNVRIVNVK